MGCRASFALMANVSAYENLCGVDRDAAPLHHAASILGWDQEVNMPPKGLAQRSAALASLAGELHRRYCQPQIAEWLSDCESDPFSKGSVEAANVSLWRESYDRRTKFPGEFVEEKSRTSSEAKAAWAEARKKSDFSLFAPLLKRQVDIARREAEYIGYEDQPYDALIKLYERGMTTANLQGIFGSFRDELTQIAGEAVERTKANPPRAFEGEFSIEGQQTFNREVAEWVGFDFEAGRIDTTTHPFCSGISPGDTRMTTRYYPKDFTASLYGVMHESGHGLYDQGLPVEHFPHPVYDAVSLGIHESQSRLWENHIGRSLEFWNSWGGRAGEIFPQLSGWTPEEMTAAVNRADYTFIRVDADEATYDLHIALRFEMELLLLNREIEVADVPKVWNEKFKAMFGLVVPGDAQGCLQDIHWSMGALGYFPTYTLGNLGAAQLMESAMEDTTVSAAFGEGNPLPLLDWMRSEVHQIGSSLTPPEIIEKATGQPLKPDAFLRHLRKRFL